MKVLPAAAELFPGDLLVTLPGATLRSKNGAVAVKALADYDGKSPFPALEAGFTLNDAKDADLDVALDRGRIDLTNTREAGAAVVRLRYWGRDWKITLDAPGARVGLEAYSRWPSGSRFQVVNPDSKGKPPTAVASLAILLISGAGSAESAGLTVGLKAPPGPALVEWDSLATTPAQPQKLEQSPSWADPDVGLSENGRRAAAAVEKFRQARVDTPATAINTFLASSDVFEQRVGLVSLGATDDLAGLIQQLSGARGPEIWDFGIRVIRHWLGRTPGNDQVLYRTLVSPAQGYSPAHARIIMRLLFGFSADDLRRPETYEVLLDYLTHDQPAVRNLAAWHLVRAVPPGKDLGFKPGAGKPECEIVAQTWKKWVPPGQLPPLAPKKD
jgi:hypothetical protein